MYSHEQIFLFCLFIHSFIYLFIYLFFLHDSHFLQYDWFLSFSKAAEKRGFGIIPAFCGHGIGSYFHGPPDIVHIGKY